jgi:hypothetical protein
VLAVYLMVGFKGVDELSKPKQEVRDLGVYSVMHPQITELLKQAGWYLRPLLLATAADWQDGDATFWGKIGEAALCCYGLKTMDANIGRFLSTTLHYTLRLAEQHTALLEAAIHAQQGNTSSSGGGESVGKGSSSSSSRGGSRGASKGSSGRKRSSKQQGGAAAAAATTAGMLATAASSKTAAPSSSVPAPDSPAACNTDGRPTAPCCLLLLLG